MVKIKKNNTKVSLEENLKEQPFQLELFRLTEIEYTNAFEFYESIPRIIAGGDRASYITPEGKIESIKRNPDGTALPIEKVYEYKGKGYSLQIKPALIKIRGKKFKAIFPGIRESVIEFILFKLAVQKGYFYDGENGDDTNTDNFILFTSIYEIKQELKKRKGRENASYSGVQIKEALEVLQETNLHLKSKEADNDFKFSPIVEFGYFNKGKKNDETGKMATVYVKFNSLISKAILSKNWRLINYDNVMQDDSYLSRWFQKTLRIRFVYANDNRTYNILLSTIINLSGISPYGRMSYNIAYARKTLESMDIVERVEIEKKYTMNPETNRNVITDAKFSIYPTNGFIQEQINTNTHHKRLKTAIQGYSGKAVLEPRKEDYPTYKEYEIARREYLSSLENKEL